MASKKPIKISNASKSPITLPDGTSIGPGQSDSVEKWDERHPVVAALLKSGALQKGGLKPSASVEPPEKSIQSAVEIAVKERDDKIGELEASAKLMTEAGQKLLGALDAEPPVKPEDMAAAIEGLATALGVEPATT